MLQVPLETRRLHHQQSPSSLQPEPFSLPIPKISNTAFSVFGDTLTFSFSFFSFSFSFFVRIFGPDSSASSSASFSGTGVLSVGAAGSVAIVGNTIRNQKLAGSRYLIAYLRHHLRLFYPFCLSCPSSLVTSCPALMSSCVLSSLSRSRRLATPATDLLFTRSISLPTGRM